jgi:hypothetical protein
MIARGRGKYPGPDVPNRDQYRKKATDCISQAELLREPQERAALLAIAQMYLKLANRIRARHERGTAHREQGDQHPENDS